MYPMLKDTGIRFGSRIGYSSCRGLGSAVVEIETQRVPDRDEVPVEHTWDLTTVYATDAAWGEDVAWIETKLPEIAALQGTLAQGAPSLVQALRLRDEIEMRTEQVSVYALQRRDSDSADP